MNGVSALIKETPKKCLAHSAMLIHSQKITVVYAPGSRPHQTRNLPMS